MQTVDLAKAGAVALAVLAIYLLPIVTRSREKRVPFSFVTTTAILPFGAHLIVTAIFPTRPDLRREIATLEDIQLVLLTSVAIIEGAERDLVQLVPAADTTLDRVRQSLATVNKDIPSILPIFGRLGQAFETQSSRAARRLARCQPPTGQSGLSNMAPGRATPARSCATASSTCRKRIERVSRGWVCGRPAHGAMGLAACKEDRAVAHFGVRACAPFALARHSALDMGRWLHCHVRYSIGAMPGYDAFISYSHAADAQLAPALQRALQRFAKPWWKLRALNLFRDETSLAAASSLSGALLKALDTSRFFILLASPRAAGSRWCNEEVAHWLDQRSPDTLLIVLTEGTLIESLPPALSDAVREEPYWLDLSWARQGDQVSERDPRFQQVVAKLAATLHGRSLEDISGEDVRQHRRTRHVAMSAMAALLTLAVGAGAAAWKAIEARDAAEKSEREATLQRDQARRVQAKLLAEIAKTTLERGDFGTALALALEALPRNSADRERPYVVEAERALREVMMAPIRETGVVRAGGKAKLFDLLDGGIAVLEEQKTRATSGLPRVESTTLHLLDAAAGLTLAVLSGHQGAVSDVTISDGGRFLLSGSDDGTARLWDLANNKGHKVFPGHKPGERMNVALSHDNRMVVTASADYTVRLWRVADDGGVDAPQILLSCVGTMQQGPSVMFSPDDRFIAVGCLGGVHLWSIELNREMLLEQPKFQADWGVAPQLAFLGGRLYAASQVRMFHRIGPLVWDVATGKFEGIMLITSTLDSLQASKDGLHMLATFSDHSVKVWTLNGGDPLVLPHPLSVVQVKMLSDGMRVITLTGDGTARLWDLSGKLLAQWRGFTGEANRISLSRDERSAVMAERRGDVVHVWELANHDVRTLPRPPVAPSFDPSLPNLITALAISADGSRVAAAYRDGRGAVWNASDARLISTIDGGQMLAIRSLEFSPTDPRLLLSASDGADARLWNSDNGNPIATLVTQEGYPYRGTPFFSGNGEWLAGESLYTAILWDGRSGALKKTLKLDAERGPASVSRLSFSRDGRHLLAAGPIRPIAIPGLPARDVQGTAAQIFSGPDWTQSVFMQDAEHWYAADISLDGTAILVVQLDGVRLLSPVGGESVLITRDLVVSDAVFAPDGRTVLLRSRDKVWVWSPDGHDGGRIVEFATGAGAEGYKDSLSPEGARLLIISRDGKAQLWDLASSALLSVLPLDDTLRHVRFAAGSIVTGSDDEVLRVWRYPQTTAALLDNACSLQTRPLSRDQRRAFSIEEDPKDPPCGWHPDMKEKPPYVPKAAGR